MVVNFLFHFTVAFNFTTNLKIFFHAFHTKNMAINMLLCYN